MLLSNLNRRDSSPLSSSNRYRWLQVISRILRICCWMILFVGILGASLLIAFLLFPPFGNADTARVLLVGLDDVQREGGPQRSDTIMLSAANLKRSRMTLLSVPRDARVRIPGRASHQKINAAYARGGIALLQRTLAQPDVLQADLPYYLIFDSLTVAAIIDALGGIEVNVTDRMKYDDHWGNLHIDLHPGQQRLDGQQTVGYLRWRKNNSGGGGSDDYARAERQRMVVIEMKRRMLTFSGMLRLPAVYRAFRTHAKTNMSVPQLIAWMSTARGDIISEAVPGQQRTIGRVSYIICEWNDGRRRWQQAQQ